MEGDVGKKERDEEMGKGAGFDIGMLGDGGDGRTWSALRLLHSRGEAEMTEREAKG
jgi:hypothetical protein